MASSLRLETIGKIMIPMTIEALKALKTEMSPDICLRIGVTNNKAKYP